MILITLSFAVVAGVEPSVVDSDVDDEHVRLAFSADPDGNPVDLAQVLHVGSHGGPPAWSPHLDHDGYPARTMASRRKPSLSGADAITHLRELGLRRYPGAHLKSPWPGHLDLAVNDKTFAYLSAPGDPPGLSLKLPLSCSLALALPGAEPTGYGLGKSGWVSLSLDDHPVPPQPQLEAWLDESYRSQAPKRLLAQFDASVGASTPRPPTAAKGRPARKRGT